MCTEVLNVYGKYLPHIIVPIKGDGACLFRALSFVMYDTQELAYGVRREITNYVAKNWSTYAVMSFDVNGDNYNSPELYMDEMMRPFTFGSLCELTAASQKYRYNFEVYRHGELYTSTGELTNPARRLRFTSDLSSGHFDAYVPKIPIGWYRLPYNPYSRLPRAPLI